MTRIIGCGNPDRGDDGAGVLVVRRLRDLGIEAEACSGEALQLLEAFCGGDDVIIVDSVATGAPPGTVQCWDGRQLRALRNVSTSTHGFSVAEAIELARVLGRLPRRLRVYGIEGQQFGPGAQMSPEVERAVEELVQQIAIKPGIPLNS